MRALIAEDDPCELKAIVRAINVCLGAKAEPHERLISDIETAETYKIAFLLLFNEPDIVIADATMFSREQLRDFIRFARGATFVADGTTKKPVYVCLVSGLDELQLAALALSTAPNDWIRKPIPIGTLAAKIWRWHMSHRTEGK